MQTNRNVFIVDNSREIRESLRALVSAHGHNAETFTGGREFLNTCDDQTAGCLIVDIRLPDMSGLEVLDTLAVMGIRLPAIVVSANAEVPMAVRALRSGAIDFLEKPCVWPKLKASIDQALNLDALSRKVMRQFSAIEERLALLSPQEQHVMEMLIAGRPNKSIAAKLDISLRTVEFRRARVLQVLEVQSISAVVAVNVVHDHLMRRSSRPLNEWTNARGFDAQVSPSFTLCPDWIHQPSGDQAPSVAASTEPGPAETSAVLSVV